MSRTHVVDPALEPPNLDLLNSHGVEYSLQLTHFLFCDLCKTLEIDGMRGVRGVKMPQKFLTFGTFGTPLRRTMSPLLLVGTALEPPNLALSNAHLMVSVPLLPHIIFELKCSTLDEQNVKEFQGPKMAVFRGFWMFPSPPEPNHESYRCAWHGVGTAQPRAFERTPRHLCRTHGACYI